MAKSPGAPALIEVALALAEQDAEVSELLKDEDLSFYDGVRSRLSAPGSTIAAGIGRGVRELPESRFSSNWVSGAALWIEAAMALGKAILERGALLADGHLSGALSEGDLGRLRVLFLMLVEQAARGSEGEPTRLPLMLAADMPEAAYVRGLEHLDEIRKLLVPAAVLNEAALEGAWLTLWQALQELRQLSRTAAREANAAGWRTAERGLVLQPSTAGGRPRHFLTVAVEVVGDEFLLYLNDKATREVLKSALAGAAVVESTKPGSKLERTLNNYVNRFTKGSFKRELGRRKRVWMRVRELASSNQSRLS